MSPSRRESDVRCVLKSDWRELSRRDDSFDADDSSLDEASGDEIDIVVAQIKRLTRVASLEFALRVGAVIIHHFYDGDTEAWRSRGPKVSSFRRLAEHPELPLSAGALYRCVALYELCERLNAPSRWEHLGASHLRLVLGLPQRFKRGFWLRRTRIGGQSRHYTRKWSSKNRDAECAEVGEPGHCSPEA